MAYTVESIFNKPKWGSFNLEVLKSLTEKHNSTCFGISGIYQPVFGKHNPDLAIHSTLTYSVLIPAT